MASMGFSQDTVFKIMNLIDDNKDDITEGKYIEICNAMKFLYSTRSPQPQPAPRQPAPRQPAPPQPAPRQPAPRQPAPPQPAPPQPAPRQPAPQLSALARHYERLIVAHTNMLNDIRPRLTNNVKYNALINKFNENNLQLSSIIPTDTKIINNKHIKDAETYLQEQNVPLATLKNDYKTQKMIDANEEKSKLEYKIQKIQRILSRGSYY
jgi:hypothetical protein